MSYQYIKTHTEMFDVTRVWMNFMIYRSFYRTRKDVPNCQFCDKAFEQTDNTNLAFVTNKTNKLICDACANEAVISGAEEYHLKRNT